MAKMMHLYEIAQEFEEVLNFGIDDEEDGTALLALLDECQDKFEEKAENVVKFMRNIEAEALAFKSEEERLAKRRKALENRAGWLKTYLSDCMVKMRLDDIKAGLFSLKFVKNPPSLDIGPTAIIPNMYYIPQEPKLDRARLAEDIKSGVIIPDVAMKQGTRLQIK